MMATIPVVLEPSLLKVSSWQGSNVALQLGSAMYIDFTTEAKRESNWGQLIERIKKIALQPRPATGF